MTKQRQPTRSFPALATLLCMLGAMGATAAQAGPVCKKGDIRCVQQATTTAVAALRSAGAGCETSVCGTGPGVVFPGAERWKQKPEEVAATARGIALLIQLGVVSMKDIEDEATSVTKVSVKK
jgi:hypothetical protein